MNMSRKKSSTNLNIKACVGICQRSRVVPLLFLAKTVYESGPSFIADFILSLKKIACLIIFHLEWLCTHARSSHVPTKQNTHERVPKNLSRRHQCVITSHSATPPAHSRHEAVTHLVSNVDTLQPRRVQTPSIAVIFHLVLPSVLTQQTVVHTVAEANCLFERVPPEVSFHK